LREFLIIKHFHTHFQNTKYRTPRIEHKNEILAPTHILKRHWHEIFDLWFFLLILTILGPWLTIYDNFKFTFQLSKLFKFEVFFGGQPKKRLKRSLAPILWIVHCSTVDMIFGISRTCTCFLIPNLAYFRQKIFLPY